MKVRNPVKKGIVKQLESYTTNVRLYVADDHTEIFNMLRTVSGCFVAASGGQTFLTKLRTCWGWANFSVDASYLLGVGKLFTRSFVPDRGGQTFQSTLRTC